MTEHDSGYKLLFSHREMVEDLLRGFLDVDWMQDLDFSTRSGSATATSAGSCASSVATWLAPALEDPGRGWFYLYFLLEFQSTPDPIMGLRLLDYIALLLAGLVRSGEVRSPTPAGRRPVVLYNGKRPGTSRST